MDFPKFIEDAIATRPIYWHLRENENAKLKINHAIADFEEKLALERRGSYMWAFEVSALNEKAVLQYDRPWGSSDFEEYAPVTWKKGAEHLSDLIYLFCNAVAESARSASELHNLKDCLDAMSESFTYAYYDSKLDSGEENGKFREEFHLLFRVGIASRIDLLVGSCWQWYRKRLGDALDQAETGEWMDSSLAAIPPSDSLRSSHGRTTILTEEATSSERRRRIDDFIASVLSATGRKILRKDIWRAAGYSDDTEFLRYQRDAPRTTGSALVAFERVLAKSPQLFLDELDKKSRNT